MDPKEIKHTLKNAREAMKNEDFKTALQLCKTVLKYDRNNYVGLVFFGRALQGSEQKDQAPNAFKKAIEVSPKQILAWQGLASYYEKENSEKHQKELIAVYQQLLALESDVEKSREICKKLALLSVKLSLLEDCPTILTELMENASPEQNKIISRTLTSTLSQEKEISPKLLAVLEKLLEKAVKDPSTEDANDYYKKYLKVLYKNKNNTLLLFEARNMHLLFPDSTSALQWICKIYSESIALNVNVTDDIEDNIEEYCKKLEKLDSESSLALFAKAAKFFKNENFVESLGALKEVVKSLSYSCYVWILLCRCYLHMHCCADAEHCAAEALKIISKEDLHEHLENFVLALLVKSLSLQAEEDKLKDAISECLKILKKYPGNLDVIECLTRAHIMIGNQYEAEKCLQALENECNSSPSRALLTALYWKKQSNIREALEILEDAVLKEQNSPELWLELGKLHWEEKRYNQSLNALLKATKLDPHSYVCYMYLGHYYSQANRDLDRARRCYQKAFRLNPNCKEAGAGLSDIYRLQKNPTANIELLTYVTQTVGCVEAKWAWLRLGLHHIDQGNHQIAIDCMLSVIRAEPTDSYSWECLADAYYGRGAYTAALKSYQRVLELDPEAVYPAFQLGNIKQLIGLYEESIDNFKDLLCNHPTYVPALKGLGETHLCIARNYFSQQLLGCCRDNCQRAVDLLTKATEERKDLSCLWKLIGDACTLTAQLPEKYSNLCIASWIINSLTDCDEEKADGDGELFVLGKEKIFEQGIRCYCRALSLNPNNSLVWHDLAYIYNLKATYMDDPNIKNQLRGHAFAAVKKCIILNSNEWQHWNLLGVISASPELNKLALAQHAFIKSIQIESNSIAWTNLGTLYLTLNEVMLAHKIFNVAQRTEPSYAECWIGQALIAEILKHEDAMDLFRHAAQLGIHTESCIGYSHWVCTTLKSNINRNHPEFIYGIKRMFAIPVAENCMIWYTAHINKNACAFNMLGLLLERRQLYQGAAEAFEAALHTLDNSRDCALLDIVHSNYARVLVQLQHYEHAIQQYQQVKKADFVTQCGLALAYFKANKFEESYSAYETALEWLAPTDGLKSHILVAMAAVAYMCQGVEESKTLLFQCIKLEPPSVQGLFAFCSLGMLHTDLTLAELALKELNPYKDNPEYLSHIAVFKAYMQFLQNRTTDAVRVLSSTVHRHPGQPSLWLETALLLLNLCSEYKTSGAATCAEVAMFLGRSSMDVSKVMSLVSLSHLLTGKASESLTTSQKAVFMFPHIPENWVVLVASFLPWCIHHRSAENTAWLKRLIGHVRRKLDATRQMNQWLSNYERKVSILTEEYKKE